ncbi:zinc finger protein 346 [Megalopta genalis]|uniref:zinc finger protein 346 n=1 Tax=Megalopta genalis TaxID=115081 RepID=UPI0014437FAD|nr:zinc finger protein 346-like [Megalopta genalis]
MSSAKIIENPEIPGLECFLPPPPPPPPPVASPKSNNVQSPGEQPQPEATPTETATSTCPSEAPAITVPASVAPFPNLPVPAPYMMHPAMQPQTPGQPATPWWIPNDADTSDLYARWYDTTYKAAAAAAAVAAPAIQVGKSKTKHHKRKNEFIDPAQDAEKVASAQRELSALMKPLKCDLCNAVMNSTLQAKLHYDGKPHQKKVSMFLNQSVKKQKTEDGQVTSTTNDWQNYCDICKTWFTSQTDATQHYAGKKHIRAANGGRRARPSKKSQSQNQYNQIDPTGRYNVGTGFQPEVQPPAVTQPVVPDGTAALPTPGTATLYTPPPYPTPLRCDLCGVSANRQDQLETHKRGARHLRMLRLNGLPVPEPATENETTPTTPGPIDYSIYRTPSGQYYCAPCNLSLNSESMFAQHVESKKHKNQSNPKSPSNAAVVSKKARFKKK